MRRAPTAPTPTLSRQDSDAVAANNLLYHGYQTEGHNAYAAGDWAAAQSKYEAAKRIRELSRNIYANAGIPDPGDHVTPIMNLTTWINYCQIHIDAARREAERAAQIAQAAIDETNRINALATSGSKWGRPLPKQ